ncbi:uncharacterized protein DDB_G0290685-like [Haliotis rubra]|uniref:uncharacterized protein DDB_G0290685-like n=1 Tax=Haliotis rubra TaxID=36100 RepID=UPI001EE58A79|nr:uncharacterized protein DDB_G0290685-like [Haliotis rubra]
MATFPELVVCSLTWLSAATSTRKGKRGIPGSPGYLDISFFRIATRKWQHVSLEKAFESSSFKFNIESSRVELDRGMIEINADDDNIVENLALAFSVSLLHVLCQPRPRGWEPGHTLDTCDKRGTKVIRSIPSENLALVLACGFLAATPSNFFIRSRQRDPESVKGWTSGEGKLLEEHYEEATWGGAEQREERVREELAAAVWGGDMGNGEDKHEDQAPEETAKQLHCSESDVESGKSEGDCEEEKGEDTDDNHLTDEEERQNKDDPEIEDITKYDSDTLEVDEYLDEALEKDEEILDDNEEDNSLNDDSDRVIDDNRPGEADKGFDDDATSETGLLADEDQDLGDDHVAAADDQDQGEYEDLDNDDFGYAKFETETFGGENDENFGENEQEFGDFGLCENSDVGLLDGQGDFDTADDAYALGILDDDAGDVQGFGITDTEGCASHDDVTEMLALGYSDTQEDYYLGGTGDDEFVDGGNIWWWRRLFIFGCV